MQRALVVFAAIVTGAALVGCGGARTPRPNLATPTNYRQALSDRAARLSGAIDAAYARCAGDSPDRCREALRTQEMVVKDRAFSEKLRGAPPGCGPLVTSYTILYEDARYFIAQVQAIAAQDDPAAIRRTAAERLVSVRRGESGWDAALASEQCR